MTYQKVFQLEVLYYAKSVVDPRYKVFHEACKCLRQHKEKTDPSADPPAGWAGRTGKTTLKPIIKVLHYLLIGKKRDKIKQDGEMVNEPGLGRGEWITISGARIFVGEDKEIKAGAEGKFNGQNIKDYKEQENAQDRIKDGTYPSRVMAGAQRKHVPGTAEFQQKRQQAKKDNPSNEPAKLNTTAANYYKFSQALVNEYKGTGKIKVLTNGVIRETIKADRVIGKTWLNKTQQYMNTNTFDIHYSNKGTHIHPRYPT
ncbi:MAG: polymorphic toxin type 50 domain-containing protein [Defluviitaleaceae bacterium]|nr:polymorphic toxin type 50 domain-containing protein [Defluviitaleaceae bacterium]